MMTWSYPTQKQKWDPPNYNFASSSSSNIFFLKSSFIQTINSIKQLNNQFNIKPNRNLVPGFEKKPSTWVREETQHLGSNETQVPRFSKDWVLEGLGSRRNPSAWVREETQHLGYFENPTPGFFPRPRFEKKPNAWVLPKAWVPTNPTLGFSKEPSRLGSRRNPAPGFLKEPNAWVLPKAWVPTNPALGFQRTQRLGSNEPSAWVLEGTQALGFKKELSTWVREGIQWRLLVQFALYSSRVQRGRRGRR
ncbi:hypothetical protein SLEP1_g50710 [Rubroshorea leprosula]|uniref:Uncharacterized protein n=1 Tax=Rubroshorea leprosula TaxID=152421 RepID=A0AAV5M301_9ROSI|nr:hypothetical protein SLEP1_g50710 [Rubroshorea leprosula]